MISCVLKRLVESYTVDFTLTMLFCFCYHFRQTFSPTKTLNRDLGQRAANIERFIVVDVALKFATLNLAFNETLDR